MGVTFLSLVELVSTVVGIVPASSPAPPGHSLHYAEGSPGTQNHPAFRHRHDLSEVAVQIYTPEGTVASSDPRATLCTVTKLLGWGVGAIVFFKGTYCSLFNYGREP